MLLGRLGSLGKEGIIEIGKFNKILLKFFVFLRGRIGLNFLADFFLARKNIEGISHLSKSIVNSGSHLARLPVHPLWGSLLLHASSESCLAEALSLVAMARYEVKGTCVFRNFQHMTRSMHADKLILGF